MDIKKINRCDKSLCKFISKYRIFQNKFVRFPYFETYIITFETKHETLKTNITQIGINEKLIRP